MERFAGSDALQRLNPVRTLDGRGDCLRGAAMLASVERPLNNVYTAAMETDRVAGTSRKPRGQGFSRRAEILNAAKNVFLAEGYERATIRKIAAAVGVSSGALYLYFPDKDAILRGIAEATFEALLAALEWSRRGIDDPLGRLLAGMRAYVAFGRAHPDEYRLTFLSKMMSTAAPGRSGEPCGDIDAADRSFDILLGDVIALVEAGVFRPVHPNEAAETLWACMHGATAVILDHADHIETEPDHLAERVLATAVRGLRASPN